MQCGSKPVEGSDLCGVHRACPHGRVTGPIPEDKLDQFRKMALGPAKPSKQWYSRQIMWAYASEMRSDLNYLSERDPAGHWKLSDAEYERCLSRMQKYISSNTSHAGRPGLKLLERGAGVRSRDDRGAEADAEGRYGAARERYNGRGGGKVFKWYSRAVFNNVLARWGASEESCTER